MEAALLIFVPKITPRISYTFSLFFNSIFYADYKITENENEYKAYEGPKFNYSTRPIEDENLFFYSSSLLSETGINNQSILVSEWNGLKIFYQVNKGVLPLDLFAASFYLVSRYEEYLAVSLDKHKRFRANDSLAFKNQFLNLPLVNLWALELKKILLEKYPKLSIKENTYAAIHTVDIDIAYAHLGRTWKITLGSYLRAFLRFDFKEIADKTFTLIGSRKDKYDTYDYQESTFKKYSLKPIYFFLAGNRGKYDKNVSPETKRFHELIKKLESFADIGIHPSYKSNSVPEIVEQEIKRIENSLSTRITKSRQHFLKISLPETYRCLTKLNIRDDYSLAYASYPGFRASICTPFLFYDLQKEETLPVKVHPSIVMDGTLNDYMNISTSESVFIIKDLIKKVKQCNGEFISILHNDNLSELGRWKGWREVFEVMIKESI